MPTLTVNVARVESRSTLWIEQRTIEKLPELVSADRYSAVVVLSDARATQACQRVCSAFQISQQRVLNLSGGESQKNSTELLRIWDFFSEQKIDRKSLIIVIGGGATTDLGGFAAATFMRGVPFILIPTTLLAQVDASIGGKSGINFRGIKNLIGSITQPLGVAIDLDTLESLPLRERRSGFAEIVKHGVIADRNYFDLVTSQDCTKWSHEQMVDIVFRSCQIKRDIVESDETEKGPRKLLNFGHSIGHAIESLLLERDCALTHGEAVAIGMYGEAVIAKLMGVLSSQDLDALKRGLDATGLPTHLPVRLANSEMRAMIARDKKNTGGRVNWTLLKSIGCAQYDVEAPEEIIEEALSTIQPAELAE